MNKPTELPAETGEEKKATFGRTYWMLNGIELWERLAYFGMRSVVPVYIMQADNPGGLHFTAADKGIIYLFWFLFQSVLPMFTGGYADRYGYKKTLFVAVSMNIIGYIMMANLRTFPGFFAGVLVLAAGTALFKPSLQGSLAQNLTKDRSSLGWGIFYWVVNIGAAIGPFMADAILTAVYTHSPDSWFFGLFGDVYSQASWRSLFLASAMITTLNYLMMLTFKDVPSGASKEENPFQVFLLTIKNIVEPRLVAWLIIMSCFWLMMYQVWDLHPNFLEDWVDSGAIASHVPWNIQTDRGVMVPQHILLNLNALWIIVFMVPISWMVRKMRVLECMIFGMALATAGTLVSGFTNTGMIFLLGIVFFSTGEMMTGPKKNEYLGLIAPPGKKGLYLGYVNIPVGIGGGFGAVLAGYLYGQYGEKATLALKYLVQHTDYLGSKIWDGKVSSLEAITGISRTEAMAKLVEYTGMDPVTATRTLWDLYNPQYHVWIPFAAIGIVAIIALIIFSQMAKKWSDMDA
ncbi:transporter [candidate division LCP-89 bacterium B3_LCP]|uniref:Transporter n=1 Tax=candidate division LCP-89 bacterium B3_LCP TaxID=2012998 RepID=A0A532UYV0_UNCL8|nr:MAG: transporter [candidate division LCP-89 bacterium B3_LCP]